MKLTEEDKDFITKHILHGYHPALQARTETAKFQNALSSFLTQMEDIWTLQTYQKKSSQINESSYSHQVVKGLFDFLLNGIENIGKEYNTQSWSTKNRNGKQAGPRRYPDLMASRTYRDSRLKCEFLFVEISNGPYSFCELHYDEDELRLCKFAKDSWNEMHSYIRAYNDPDSLKQFNDFVHLTIHIYCTTMDIYISDHKMEPFHQMCLVDSLSIPLVNENISSTIPQVYELVEGLLTLNNLVKQNLGKLDLINNSNTLRSTPPIMTPRIPTAGTPKKSS